GFLAGVGFSGDRFFYPNPLEADGETKFNHGSAERQPWFGTSCCPTNVARFLPSLLGWVYAQKDNALYVNLFMDSTAEFEHAGGKLKITQTTRYPWEGEVTITLTPDAPRTFPVLVRMPGWARHAPVPSNLYRYLMPPSDTLVLINGAVDGTATSRPLENDYLRFEREWKAGDTITLRLPMPVQGVVAHEKVEADRGKVALERGPVVYCVEGSDNTGDLGKLELSDAAEIRPEWRPELLGGVTVLRSETPGFIAIPYYAWGHRGANAMRVWLARSGS
ncbi:MAG: glycoside hydrolase family 127 protein, partial [Candidatus Hydrogenedentes bacterium]|nr:glycoside hydrolase family 127 protein [Candidatus Hydrogenedentota bacterium]